MFLPFASAWRSGSCTVFTVRLGRAEGESASRYMFIGIVFDVLLRAARMEDLVEATSFST